MTDIELRKAAINKLKYKSLITTEDDDFDYIAFPKGGRDDFIEAFYELLAPSPQSSDNEVDELLKDIYTIAHARYEAVLPLDKLCAQKVCHLVLKAMKSIKAQQPRQEWKTMESAPRDGTMILAWHPEWEHGCGVTYWSDTYQKFMVGDREQPIKWTDRPEPPKDKP